MKDFIPLNEKHRMCISSRDFNYARNNLYGSVKDDVDFAEIQQMFLFCFIYEYIYNY